MAEGKVGRMKRNKRSGKRLPPVNGEKRNANADAVRVTGKLLEQRAYALECMCAGCHARVIAPLPAQEARRYTQGVDVPVECDACGQRVVVSRPLVLS